MDNKDEMLDFLKALAHADRLKIVGMLSQAPANMAEIAAGLSLPPREVYNHLAFLEYVGVIHKVADHFELDTDGLEKLARRRFQGERQVFTPEAELGEDQRKVLATFLNADGSIRQFPNSRTQPGKFKIILEYALAAFEPGVNYTEKEVNTVLVRFNQDVAGLRRDLVDMGMMARERDGSRYWRVA